MTRTGQRSHSHRVRIKNKTSYFRSNNLIFCYLTYQIYSEQVTQICNYSIFWNGIRSTWFSSTLIQAEQTFSLVGIHFFSYTQRIAFFCLLNDRALRTLVVYRNLRRNNNLRFFFEVRT